jgi:hypothetical protein
MHSGRCLSAANLASHHVVVRLTRKVIRTWSTNRRDQICLSRLNAGIHAAVEQVLGWNRDRLAVFELGYCRPLEYRFGVLCDQELGPSERCLP